jgi:hypothetical protein
MSFLVGHVQGIAGEPGEVHTSAKNALGMRSFSQDGNEYIYLQGCASTVATDWVTFDEAFATTRLVSTGAAGNIAIATAAVNSTSSYGWYQVGGSASGNSATTVVDNAQVYATTTAGRVDDDILPGALISGAVFRSTAVSNVATFSLDNPKFAGAGSDLGGTVKVLAAAFDVDSGTSGSTLTSLSGISWPVVAGATYRFHMTIPHITTTTNSGAKMAFKLTTATLTSVNLRVWSSTDTDNTEMISVNFTNTADQAPWFDQKAVVYTWHRVDGTLVVNAAGSIAVQAAQNATHADNTTIDAGAVFELTRLA